MTGQTVDQSLAYQQFQKIKRHNHAKHSMLADLYLICNRVGSYRWWCCVCRMLRRNEFLRRVGH